MGRAGCPDPAYRGGSGCSGPRRRHVPVRSITVSLADPPTPSMHPGGYAELATEIRSLGLLRPRPRFYAGLLAVDLTALAATVAGMVVLQRLVVGRAARPGPGGRLDPARVPRSRGGAPAGHPPPGRDPAARPAVRQPAQRAELVLVDREAQRAPRPPQRPRHGPGRARGGVGVRRRPGGRPSRRRRVDDPPPGLAVLPVPDARGGQPARVERAGAGPPRRAAPAWSRASCCSCTSWRTAPCWSAR